jgi:hypothetical protein
MKGIFLRLSTKGYKHYTENTVEELDQLPLTNHHIITEFAHLREWLRVNHGIWVFVAREPETGVYYPNIDVNKGDKYFDKFDDYDSPKEAYSAAFDYILKELI